MALVRFSRPFDPINALLNLQQEFDRVFENPLGLDLGISGRGAFPPMNVFSDANGHTVRMEIPGVSAENIAIEAHGRTLTISGKRELKTPAGASFHRRERSGGDFSRSLQLPADLDLEHVEASCKHGMLTLRIPKKAEAKPRQITIKTA
jgi:HSP20 family protein